MSLLEHNQTVLDNLEPGDLLQFDRGTYDHWAVYVGNKEVVHVTGVDGQMRSCVVHLASISGIMFDKGVVRKDPFWEVAARNKVIRNNSKDEKLRHFEPSKIVQRALDKVGEDGYNILFKNCEHFATWCRYGIEISDQVRNLLTAVASIVLGAVVAWAGRAVANLFRSGRNAETESSVPTTDSTAKTSGFHSRAEFSSDFTQRSFYQSY